MHTAAKLIGILRNDPTRWHLLGVVAALDLPDCWIAAGFVRNAAWDHLHRRRPWLPSGDVDVIWYDADKTSAAHDRDIEATLCATEPSIAWSVKNQARMHLRNGDAPYRSAVDAMRYWPETATAVAARRSGEHACEIAAPWGLGDLMNLILRPAGRFNHEKRAVYDDRVQTKGWLKFWPQLQQVDVREAAFSCPGAEKMTPLRSGRGGTCIGPYRG